MSQSKEEQLRWAAFGGRLEAVKSLATDPAIKINGNEGEASIFFVACVAGDAGVVEYLLSLKEVDPIKPNKDGTSPFFMACILGHKEVVSLLLADPRIDPNQRANNVFTPLWYATKKGYLGIVQRLLASKRNIDTKFISRMDNTTAAEHGRATGARTTKVADEEEEEFQRMKTCGPLCADLIDAYEKDPAKIRSLMRELQERDTLVSSLVARKDAFPSMILALPL